MVSKLNSLIYFPKRPFLGAATGAFFAATAPLAAGLATTLAATLAAGLAATLAATLAAGLAAAFAGAAAGSAFFPKEPKRPAFFTGAGGATGTGAAFLDAPPPKMASRGEGGILDPGQLNDGMALTAV